MCRLLGHGDWMVSKKKPGETDVIWLTSACLVKRRKETGDGWKTQHDSTHSTQPPFFLFFFTVKITNYNIHNINMFWRETKAKGTHLTSKPQINWSSNISSSTNCLASLFFHICQSQRCSHLLFIALSHLLHSPSITNTGISGAQSLIPTNQQGNMKRTVPPWIATPRHGLMSLVIT